MVDLALEPLLSHKISLVPNGTSPSLNPEYRNGYHRLRILKAGGGLPQVEVVCCFTARAPALPLPSITTLNGATNPPSARLTLKNRERPICES